MNSAQTGQFQNNKSKSFHGQGGKGSPCTALRGFSPTQLDMVPVGRPLSLCLKLLVSSSDYQKIANCHGGFSAGRKLQAGLRPPTHFTENKMAVILLQLPTQNCVSATALDVKGSVINYQSPEPSS